MHFCEKNPCPVLDKEYLDKLENGFTTYYTANVDPSILTGLREYRLKRRLAYLTFFLSLVVVGEVVALIYLLKQF